MYIYIYKHIYLRLNEKKQKYTEYNSDQYNTATTLLRVTVLLIQVFVIETLKNVKKVYYYSGKP